MTLTWRALTTGASVAVLLLGTQSLPAGAAPSQASRVSAASAIASLPAGPYPVGVPYGIGKRLYLNGVGYDLTSRWATLSSPQGLPEFTAVTITRGTIVFSIAMTATDPYEALGSLSPGKVPVRIGRFGAGDLAVTSGGLVTPGVDEVNGTQAPVLTLTGAAYPPPFVSPVAPDPYGNISAQGAGGSFVFQAANTTSSTHHSYVMYPGYPPIQVPDDYTYGVGGGTGWLAAYDSRTSLCFRTAPLRTPSLLGPRICSQTRPLISPDGTRAVVVQGNHVRLYDTGTGLQINATNAPTLGAQTATLPVTGYFPFAWETAGSYLVYARDGTSLFILRCSLDRTCQRAVTSYVRSGVSSIAVGQATWAIEVS
jgi:hypothetical protein